MFPLKMVVNKRQVLHEQQFLRIKEQASDPWFFIIMYKLLIYYQKTPGERFTKERTSLSSIFEEIKNLIRVKQ